MMLEVKETLRRPYTCLGRCSCVLLCLTVVAISWMHMPTTLMAWHCAQLSQHTEAITSEKDAQAELALVQKQIRCAWPDPSHLASLLRSVPPSPRGCRALGEIRRHERCARRPGTPAAATVVLGARPGAVKRGVVGAPHRTRD